MKNNQMPNWIELLVAEAEADPYDGEVVRKIIQREFSELVESKGGLIFNKEVIVVNIVGTSWIGVDLDNGTYLVIDMKGTSLNSREVEEFIVGSTRVIGYPWWWQDKEVSNGR